MQCCGCCSGNCKEKAEDREIRWDVCNIAIDGYIPRVKKVEKNKTEDIEDFWKNVVGTKTEERTGLIASMVSYTTDSVIERRILASIKGMCEDVLRDRRHAKEIAKDSPQPEDVKEGWGWAEMFNPITLDQLEEAFNEYDKKMTEYREKLDPIVKKWQSDLKKRGLY